MQHVQVMEDDFSIQTITCLTEEAFGADSLVLVRVNALKIEDSEFTTIT